VVTSNHVPLLVFDNKGKENKWTQSIAVGSKTIVENMKDRELLRRFEEFDKLNLKDKGTIKEILDTFILKNKFQSLLAAPEQL